MLGVIAVARRVGCSAPLAPSGVMCTINGAQLLHEWNVFCRFAEKLNDMAIYNVTSRDFRSRQAEVLGIADRGEQVIIRRRNKQAYMLVPIEDSDLELSAEAMQRVEESRKEYAKGQSTICGSEDELISHLDSL